MSTQERRTKRRYAHELYPHPAEGQTRPLEDEVPYLYAHALGLEVQDTDWHDLFDREAGPAERKLSLDRMMQMASARRVALMADAMLCGMTGDEAWEWADQRAWDESGEFICDRAMQYGVPISRIRPYPVLAERQQHDHWSEPDQRGFRTLIGRVDGRESECWECTEPIPEATP